MVSMVRPHVPLEVAGVPPAILVASSAGTWRWAQVEAPARRRCLLFFLVLHANCHANCCLLCLLLVLLLVLVLLAMGEGADVLDPGGGRRGGAGR